MRWMKTFISDVPMDFVPTREPLAASLASTCKDLTKRSEWLPSRNEIHWHIANESLHPPHDFFHPGLLRRDVAYDDHTLELAGIDRVLRILDHFPLMILTHHEHIEFLALQDVTIRGKARKSSVNPTFDTRADGSPMIRVAFAPSFLVTDAAS